MRFWTRRECAGEGASGFLERPLFRSERNPFLCGDRDKGPGGTCVHLRLRLVLASHWHFHGVRRLTLHLVPISQAQANEHVAAWHRHNNPVVGSVFQVGVADDEGTLRAVAFGGRPVARHYDDGQTLEVTRVASDGTRNACSMLYGACARAAFALGYTRIITYTQGDEPGSSVRASGYRLVASRPPRKGWSTPSRPERNAAYRSVQRQLWEKVA